MLLVLHSALFVITRYEEEEQKEQILVKEEVLL
jgi:hypothetical protein